MDILKKYCVRSGSVGNCPFLSFSQLFTLAVEGHILWGPHSPKEKKKETEKMPDVAVQRKPPSNFHC